MEAEYRGLGRCACSFWLAVAFDVVGLTVLLLGVFATVFFYDLLIYAGAIIIFLSLIWWVFWYSGNIEVPPVELEDDVGLLKKKGGIGGAVRRLSSRVSSGIRSSFRRSAGGRGGGGRGEGPQSTRGSQKAGQVAVAMETVAPQDVGGEMPHTSMETSAT